jgi:predicted RNase H-like HicB family nuclease
MTTNELIFLVEEDPEGGYNAKALGQSIFVQGDTFETLKGNIKDALECHFDSKEDIPEIKCDIVKKKDREAASFDSKFE